MNLNNNQSYHTNHKLGDLAYQHQTYDTAAEIYNVNRDVNHTSLWLLVKAFFVLVRTCQFNSVFLVSSDEKLAHRGGVPSIPVKCASNQFRMFIPLISSSGQYNDQAV